MSVKKEPSGRRSIQVEVELPGTPEEIWRVIATGPGVSAWFVPVQSDEKVDGKIVSHFGPGMDSVATITEWQPPHRFAAVSNGMGPNAPALATEWIVEARSGGTCVVRVVHSLFASTDDWDNQLESVESGWPSFFRILRLYVTAFRGLPAATLQLMAFTPGTVPDAWARFTDSLGIAGRRAGDQWSTPPGTPPASGTIESAANEVKAHAALLRLETPSGGAVMANAMKAGPQVCIPLMFYLYGDDAKQVAERVGPAWQAWLRELFPAPDPTSVA
jgi:uncharacterized protein YndB with AHSA1/START domain